MGKFGEGTLVLGLDVGGTNTRAGLMRLEAGALQKAKLESLVTVSSGECRDIVELIQRALTEAGRGMGEDYESLKKRVGAVGIGVAGPVTAQIVNLTNLKWRISGSEVQAKLGVPVRLVNDLEAVAYGLSAMKASDLETLREGTAAEGNRVVIAAGTGLGEALVIWDGKKYIPVPCEGGHSSFSPIDEDDVGLWQFIKRRHRHVSWERVVSGKYGFANIFEYLSEVEGLSTTPSGPADTAAKDEWRSALGPSLVAAARGGDRLAERALTWFCRLYGVEASNLALKAWALGGVYVAGGIATELLPWMKREFLVGFDAKGRFGSVVQQMPVHVISDALVGLKGAAVAVLE